MQRACGKARAETWRPARDVPPATTGGYLPATAGGDGGLQGSARTHSLGVGRKGPGGLTQQPRPAAAEAEAYMTISPLSAMASASISSHSSMNLEMTTGWSGLTCEQNSVNHAATQLCRRAAMQPALTGLCRRLCLTHAHACDECTHARIKTRLHTRMDAWTHRAIHDESNKAVGAARCTLGDCRLSGTFARMRCAWGAWGAPTQLPRDTRRARTRN